jgi:hypothetical protein
MTGATFRPDCSVAAAGGVQRLLDCPDPASRVRRYGAGGSGRGNGCGKPVAASWRPDMGSTTSWTAHFPKRIISAPRFEQARHLGHLGAPCFYLAAATQ